jgi:hypothetical protein
MPQATRGARSSAQVRRPGIQPSDEAQAASPRRPERAAALPVAVVCRARRARPPAAAAVRPADSFGTVLTQRWPHAGHVIGLRRSSGRSSWGAVLWNDTASRLARTLSAQAPATRQRLLPSRIAPCICARSSDAPCICAPVSDAPCICASSDAPCICAKSSDAPRICVERRALHLRSVERRALHLRAVERRALHLRAFERRALHLRAFERRTLHLRSVERRALEPGAVEPSAHEDRSRKVRLAQWSAAVNTAPRSGRPRSTSVRATAFGTPDTPAVACFASASRCFSLISVSFGGNEHAGEQACGPPRHSVGLAVEQRAAKRERPLLRGEASPRLPALFFPQRPAIRFWNRNDSARWLGRPDSIGDPVSEDQEWIAPAMVARGGERRRNFAPEPIRPLRRDGRDHEREEADEARHHSGEGPRCNDGSSDVAPRAGSAIVVLLRPHRPGGQSHHSRPRSSASRPRCTQVTAGS